MVHRRQVIAAICALFLLGFGTVSAAPPTLRNLDRRGLQIGGSTVLTLDGDNLLPNPKLVLSAPIVKQAVRPGATDKRIAIEITLDKNALPGLYNVWLANDKGLSAVRVVALDHLPPRHLGGEGCDGAGGSRGQPRR